MCSSSLLVILALAAPPDRVAGERLFQGLCSGCHGARGDGDTPAAGVLDPAPADLTRGDFRYRTTPTGSLPSDADLARTIRLGAPSTAMPAWGERLSRRQIRDVAAYVKTLSRRFRHEAPEDPVVIPPEPAAASLERGAQVYERQQCGKCHGKRGRGDGWARDDEMKDSRGRVIRARDFTTGRYRGGASPRDLYRTLVTGLNGTPMPAYVTVSEGELWDLVSFTLSLSRPRGFWYWLSVPPGWDDPILDR